MSANARRPVHIDVEHLMTCRECGYVGLKCEFHYKRGYLDICEVCRETESLARKRKYVEALKRKREKIITRRRAEIMRQQSLLSQPDAAQRAAGDY